MKPSDELNGRSKYGVNASLGSGLCSAQVWACGASPTLSQLTSAWKSHVGGHWFIANRVTWSTMDHGHPPLLGRWRSGCSGCPDSWQKN